LAHLKRHGLDRTRVEPVVGLTQQQQRLVRLEACQQRLPVHARAVVVERHAAQLHTTLSLL